MASCETDRSVTQNVAIASALTEESFCWNDTHAAILGTRLSHADLKRSLAEGVIPATLADELRIVPLDSESGRQFQAAMEDIALKLAPAWGQEQPRIRFFLMDLPGINACQIRGAEPPLIGFTRGCFCGLEESQEQSQKPLTTVDEVALIYAHERGHLAIERSVAPDRNSKLEEGLVSFCAVEAAFKGGFNPEAGLPRARASLLEKGLTAHWRELVDEHPTSASQITLYEAALTKLTRAHGAITRQSTPLHSEHPLVDAARNAAMETTLERFLDSQNYSSQTDAGKVRILTEVVVSQTHLEGRRLTELTKYIQQLQKGLSAENHIVLEPLFNALLERFEEINDKAMRSLLSAAAPSGLRLHPMGRLAPIADSMRAFVNAADFRTAATAAKSLNTLIAEEPLAHTPGGIDLLRRFDFAQFRFPDIEKLNRSNRPQKLSWNTHISYAYQQQRVGKSEIARALLRLGVDDPRLYPSLDAVTANQHLVEDTFSISKGPRDGSNSIHSLEIIGDSAYSFEPQYGRESERRESRLLDYLLPIAHREFEQVVTNDGLGEDSLKKLSQKIEGLSVRLRDDFCEHHLIGFSHMHLNPALFVELNREALSRGKVQLLVANTLKNLREDQKDELVAEFFQALGTTLTEISPPQLIEHSESDDSPEAWTAHSERDGQLPIQSSPLLREMMKLSESTLDLDSRQAIIAETCSLGQMLDHPLTFDRVGRAALNRHGAQHYQALLQELSVLFGECKSAVEAPKDWDQLVELLQHEEIQRSPIKREITLMQSAIISITDSSSQQLATPAQIRVALDGMTNIPKEGSASRPSADYSSRGFPGSSTQEFVLQKLTEALSKQPSWSTNLDDSIQEWRACYRAGILPKETQYTHLSEILTRIKALPDVTSRQQHFESLFGTGRDRIRSPELRQEIIHSWADSVRERFGGDDTSSDYREQIADVVLKIEEKLSPIDRKAALNTLAEAVVSQRALSQFLGSRVAPLTEEAFTRTHGMIIGLEGLTQLLAKHPPFRRDIVEFLTAPLSLESTSHITQEMLDLMLIPDEEQKPQERMRMTEGFTDLHKNFWAAPLDARALIMREVLLPQAASAAEAEDAFHYALERAFPRSTQYGAETQAWVKAYLAAVPEYVQPFALSALLVAGQRREDEAQGSGFAIATFLESMGPAETKAGQAAQGHPKVPMDIRRDLARLKTRADQPTRWELFQRLDEALPPDTQDNISHVGELLGSASLFMAVRVTQKSEDERVVSLLRPNALERAQFGFTLLSDMLEHADADSEKKEVFLELIRDARELIEIETDTHQAHVQRALAQRHYDGTSVIVDGETFHFTVPPVTQVGDEYFISELAPGEHFIDLPESPKKRALAKAILALEIHGILSGEPFDNDRHGGNCRIQRQTIGHFDFGGMLLSRPGEDELAQLGHAISTAALKSSDVTEFIEHYFSHVRELSLTPNGAPALLRRVQKALTSLAEYTEGLTPPEFQAVLIAALNHGIHPKIQESIYSSLSELGDSSFAGDTFLAQLMNPSIKIEKR